MSLEGAAVSLGATIVSVAFAALVFNQWIARRKPYQLAWSLGLGLYGAAAFLQFLAEAYGWSVATYTVSSLIAAPLVAALGIGSTVLRRSPAAPPRAPTRGTTLPVGYTSASSSGSPCCSGDSSRVRTSRRRVHRSRGGFPPDRGTLK